MKDKEMIEEIVKDITETKAQGFKVENGKLVYFSNMLDGYRREFKDLQEICEEMNGMLNKFNSLMEQVEFWQCEAKTYKQWKGKLIEQIRESRKETVEKIYREAKFIVDNTTYLIDGRKYLHLDALKEIIKTEIGVEIKE